jgi:hypothetical protein
MKLHAATHLFVNCSVQSNRLVVSVVLAEKRHQAHLQTNNFMNRFRNHSEQSIWYDRRPERRRYNVLYNRLDHVRERKKTWLRKKGAIDPGYMNRRYARHTAWESKKMGVDPEFRERRNAHSRAWKRRNSERVKIYRKKYYADHRDHEIERASLLPPLKLGKEGMLGGENGEQNEEI